MRLTMVDCRSLIEFCKAFEQHKNHTAAESSSSLSDNNHRMNHNQNHSRAKKTSFNPISHHPLCKDHLPSAAADVIILILVVGSLGFLTVPCFKLVFREAYNILAIVCDVLEEVLHNAPIAYVVGLVVAFTGVLAVIIVWEIVDMKSIKCGDPRCKGLRKAVQFDIQLESEECLKYLPATAYGSKPLELGEDHKELEAELKRMAPLNGRTVLIFRAPCGCPAGRLEVWGNKKIRRIRK